MDTSCPQASFEKVDCFVDNHNHEARPLPDYIFNDRDPSIDNFSGMRIDWRNWDVYVPQFACRCAAAAKALNHTFFGMQFYGKWELFAVYTAISRNVIGKSTQVHETRLKGSLGRSMELLHVLNTNTQRHATVKVKLQIKASWEEKEIVQVQYKLVHYTSPRPICKIPVNTQTCRSYRVNFGAFFRQLF